ncbi:MAG: TPM domain-containing protein [Deltaproteobacteria bacterium]|nr:TPM domain-containing protein [Deltaproteobacteria bacterium]
MQLLFIVIAAWLCVTAAFALEVPKTPDGYVTDRAQVLSPGVEQQLERELQRYEAATSNQIVVATFPSLEEESLEDFSIRLTEAWRVGHVKKDNGVMLLIFPNDRQLRIEVGYGLEGVLTDAQADQIIRTVITPQFREGHFDAGVVRGVQAITEVIAGEFSAQTEGGHRTMSPGDLAHLRVQGRVLARLIGGLVMVLFLLDLIRYLRYRRSHATYRGRYSFWGWWFRFAVLLFVLNMLFRVVFYALLVSRGGMYGGRSGFGGFSGGGGSFGGGGASGRW